MYRDELMAILSIKGLGIQTFQKLLQYYGSLELLIQQAKANELYRETGIKATKDCHLVLETFDGKQYDKALCKEKVNVITVQDNRYPKQLKALENYPPLLHYKGNIGLINNCLPGIAVVGSRRLSAYGRRVAYDLGVFLGQYKLPVVSGLAYGVDYEVHSGVLKSGGIPIGVVANGLESVYPKEHTKLAKKIEKEGVLLTEEFLYSDLAAYKFPIRNRLISGLSQVIVVVEAEAKSGSLITARHGLNQGKTVFAVPGSIYSPTSKGTNALISEGAIPLIDFNQLLEEYAQTVHRHSLIEETDTKTDKLNDLQGIVLQKIKTYDSVSLDVLSKSLELPISKLSGLLMQLELQGLIRSVDGNKYTIL